MENYEKGETRVVGSFGSLFAGLGSGDHVVEMRVAAGSKIRNLMGFALGKMNQAEVRQMVWCGSGHAINKTITAVEIMKRKIKGLHQVTRLGSKRIEEFWEAKVEGLERLKVNRDLPVISILLSKDSLDSTQPGYQDPDSRESAWIRPHQDQESGATVSRSRQVKRRPGKFKSDVRRRKCKKADSNLTAPASSDS